MEKLESMNISTAIDWWNDARKISNKAIKQYNKFVDGKICVCKLEKKLKKHYAKLREYTVDYSEDWGTMVSACNDTEWYKGFD